MRSCRLPVEALLAFTAAVLISPDVFAGPKGEVICRSLGTINITIDGDISDWPLDVYEQPSEQPLFPGAKDAASTDASGDHLVFDRNRIGFFNGTPDDNPQTFADARNPLGDFDSVVYVAWDQDCLYFLEVRVDDVLRADRNPGDCVNQDFGLDGLGIFMDAKNDSLDCASTGFPLFDTGAPNTDDFELGAVLHDEFRLDDQDPNDVGGRQHMERHGTSALIDKGNPCVRPDTYRAFLEARGTPNIAARSYSDLGAAGALNPVIVNNPELRFSGYALELCIPFGFQADFDPSLNPIMGFEIFWHDTDLCISGFGCNDDENDPGVGSNDVSWATWAQSISVPCPGLFDTSNWGELIFDDTNPLDGGLQLPSDSNQDGVVELADAVNLLRHLFVDDPPTVPCADGSVQDPGNRRLLDHNGDGVIDVSDGVSVLLYVFLGGDAHPLGEVCLPISGCPDSLGCGS